MGAISGKVFSAGSQAVNRTLPIGKRLGQLRALAGLTQEELATKLGMGQTALSKMESREDILLSSLKKYLEALGASLKIDAAFNSETSKVSFLEETLDVDFARDNQLVMPIFDGEVFRPTRDVILSIKPEYSQQIIDGTKKVELRRRFPINIPTGTLAYIYSTSPERALTGIAEIELIAKMPINQLWNSFSHVSGIERSRFDEYFSGLDKGFGIVFSKVYALKKSIGLQELRERFNFEPPQSFLYTKQEMKDALRHEYANLSN